MRPKRGDIVYLKTGEDKEARIITGTLKREGAAQYELTYGITSSWHSRAEFQYEKPNGKIATIKGLTK